MQVQVGSLVISSIEYLSSDVNLVAIDDVLRFLENLL